MVSVFPPYMKSNIFQFESVIFHIHFFLPQFLSSYRSHSNRADHLLLDSQRSLLQSGLWVNFLSFSLISPKKKNPRPCRGCGRLSHYLSFQLYLTAVCRKGRVSMLKFNPTHSDLIGGAFWGGTAIFGASVKCS